MTRTAGHSALFWYCVSFALVGAAGLLLKPLGEARARRPLLHGEACSARSLKLRLARRAGERPDPALPERYAVLLDAAGSARSARSLQIARASLRRAGFTERNTFLFSSSAHTPSPENLALLMDFLSRVADSNDLVVFYAAGMGARPSGAALLPTSDAAGDLRRRAEELPARTLFLTDRNARPLLPSSPRKRNAALPCAA